MKGKHFVWLLGAAFSSSLIVAACTDDTLMQPEEPVASAYDGIPESPLSAYVDLDACMGNDAVSNPANVDGFSSSTSPLAFNCTANDISIANARASTGGPIQCVPGQMVTVDIVADIVETSTSARTDIGIWIEHGDNGAGGAEDGACDFFYFDTDDIATEAGVVSADPTGQTDQCGDMTNAGTVSGFELDAITLECPTTPDEVIDGISFVRIDSCISWTQPGGDRFCAASDPRAGTLPANKSKCNCDGFLVPFDIQSQLTLQKTVVNDDGGTAVDTDWTLKAMSGSTTIEGVEGATAVTNAVVPSGAYALSESGGPSGYTAGSWSCTGTGSLVGSTVTLDPGESATCTITNNDNVPTLKLVKTVTNDDGGTAVPNNWDLTATGSSRSFTELNPAAADATARNVTAGVEYTLSETGPSGYQAGSWSCTGGGTQNVNKITLTLDEDVTCTINNDDQPSTLKLVKTVTNDDGGGAAPNDWDLSATGSSKSFTELTPAAADATARGVDAGVEYTLSETGPSGYTAGSWSCDGGTQNVNKITLALNQNVTCTINNNDNPPTLKLVKTVTNDNGGTAAPDDWDLTATGSSGSFTELTPATANATARNVTAGVEYTLSETGPSGYQAGSWSCTGGGTQNVDKITLALDEDVTCTINNDDIAPQLKLVKTVTNDDGGTAAANDWDLTASGSGGFTELSPSAATATFRTVTAAVSYALSESGPSGYTAGSWSCDGGTQSGANITLALNQQITCTINNDDIPQLSPGNSVNVSLTDFTKSGTELAGSFTVKNVSSNVASVTTINVTAQFKPSGSGGGWQNIGVSGCTFDPTLPDEIAVGATDGYTFDCDLNSAVSGGTLRVTVQVLLHGAPGKDNFTSTRSESI